MPGEALNRKQGIVRPWRRWRRDVVSLGALLAGLWFIPSWWCGREAAGYYEGQIGPVSRLADGVGAWMDRDLQLADYTTGEALFDGEWMFGTYMMAGMGFGQSAVMHPVLREAHLTRMEQCIDRLLQEDARAFTRQMWGSDPLESLEAPDAHHAAYLGYLNVLLGLHRFLDPESRFAPLNDRITAALVERVNQAPALLLMSYPHEWYPVDNCAVLGSIGLHARSTGADHGARLTDWLDRFRELYVDEESGLLIQAAFGNGVATDAPRGSGTTLGLYLLSFADEALSRALYDGVCRSLAGSILNFGGVREYPPGHAGVGDIDSGPIILGYSFSATGFSMAGSRMFSDRARFKQVYATAHLAGVPVDGPEGRSYVTGGPLGSAILFSMLTAMPPETWETPAR
jgi:hypothetical protein